MPIDPVTGLPTELTTPVPGQAPPGFVDQAAQPPLPGTQPMGDLPPGFVPNPAAAPAAPPAIPNLYQPVPPPVQTQHPAPVVAAPPANPQHQHVADNFLQQADKLAAQSQTDQAAALQKLQQAQTEGANLTSEAYGEQSRTRTNLATELQQKQQEIQQHNQQLDSIDAANLKKARDATIPDFWEGRTGDLVGSTIAVALSGIGAGLLGSTNNQALSSIQHNIDTYFHQQKERIDRLYQYAESQGKLNQNTRLEYAQELLNLKDQHSYILQAAADHVQEVAAAAKGAADAATTGFLSSKLSEQARNDFVETRKARSQMLLQASEAEKNRQQAAEAKARAANGGYLTPAQQNQVYFHLGSEIDKAFKPVTDPKGLNYEAAHLADNIKQANEQPDNPAAFVGLMDSLITAYSGGKVTQGQYKTWLSHIAPGSDTLEQALDHFRTGNASPTQKKNLIDIATGRFNSIRGDLKEHYDKFQAVTGGPEFNNPQGQQLKNRKQQEIFGSSPGFGGKEPNLGAGPVTATAPAQVKDKNGKVWNRQPDGSYL